MKCHCCGGRLIARRSDIPFKLDGNRIVIRQWPIVVVRAFGSIVTILGHPRA